MENTDKPTTPCLITQYPMTKAAADAIEFVLLLEGYESDNPYDPGEYTKFGISSAHHPDVDFPNLTRTRAITIYHTSYWLPMNLGTELHQLIYNHLLSAAVLFSVYSATRLRQLALNKFFTLDRLIIDGIPGPKTKLATACVARSHPAPFLLTYLLECKEHAALIVRQSPNLSVFIRGWLHRFDTPPLSSEFLENKRP